jgi:hypothetical protein
MVQLHAAAAGLAVSRPTADVDIVLHIESGAPTPSSVVAVLTRLGHTLQKSIEDDAPAHRFVRGEQQLDVMIADHPAPAQVPRIGGCKHFQIAGGMIFVSWAVAINYFKATWAERRHKMDHQPMHLRTDRRSHELYHHQ